jgi:hypothetical protein
LLKFITTDVVTPGHRTTQLHGPVSGFSSSPTVTPGHRAAQLTWPSLWVLIMADVATLRTSSCATDMAKFVGSHYRRRGGAWDVALRD